MIILLVILYGGLFAIVLSNVAYLRWEPADQHGPSTRVTDRPHVSVLIPARNEADNLGRLLPSILKQDYPAYNTIVYDDQSEDETVRVVEEWASRSNEALDLIHGGEVPAGWIGKSYALDSAASAATGELLLFLDADAELRHPRALDQLVSRFLSLEQPAVLTGYTRLQGGGQLLTSLVPFSILCFLPWMLVRRTSNPAVSALNGQCWMIEVEQYRVHRPHSRVRDKILEDVEIGRYLKSEGVSPVLVDVQEEMSVFMYDSFSGAWRGFQKNAYLLMGGTLLRSLASLVLFAGLFLAAPLVWPWTIIPVWTLKFITDRRSGFPMWVSACAPISLALGAALQIDSMLVHLTGRVEWKGRRV